MAIFSIDKLFQGKKQKDQFIEISTYKSPHFPDSQEDPYNPDELVGKKGLEIYDDMLIDDQVKAVYELKRKIILSKGGKISFENNENNNKNDEIIKFFNCIFDDL